MQWSFLCYTSVVLFTNWLVNEELIKSCYLFWIIYAINIHQNTHPNTHTPKYIHKNTCRGYNIVTYPQKSALFPTYFVSFFILAQLPCNQCNLYHLLPLVSFSCSCSCSTLKSWTTIQKLQLYKLLLLRPVLAGFCYSGSFSGCEDDL